MPAATPKEIISKLNSTLVFRVTATDMRARLIEQHAQIIASTSHVFGLYMRDEISKWTKVAKAVGIQAE